MALAPAYRLSLLVLLFVPFSITAQTYRNISLGSSLTTSDSNSSWASPSEEFAFGFKQIGSGGRYLLAIWFNKISESTIVWSANRDNLAPEGSKVELTKDGKLVLNDPKGQQIWSASPRIGVTYAAMLDTGNFVLASQNFVNLWESFDLPTDTLLPTQTLSRGGTLFAPFSETDYSRGRFLVRLQDDGNLVFYTVNFPLDSTNVAYWASDTTIGFQVVFNQSGFLYLAARDGTILKSISAVPYSTTNFYQRVTLETDGVLRHYAYPKSKETRADGPLSWSTLSFTPSNICLNITGDTGSGACGFNSYCKLGDEGRRTCECPSGYMLIDPTDEMSGCKQDFTPQSCDRKIDETALFTFTDMPDTDWPLSDYEHYTLVDEEWCRQACLGDCFCMVAIFRNGNCWKKKIPLSNGRIDTTVGGKALIKIRRNSTSPLINTEKKTHH